MKTLIKLVTWVLVAAVVVGVTLVAPMLMSAAAASMVSGVMTIAGLVVMTAIVAA